MERDKKPKARIGLCLLGVCLAAALPYLSSLHGRFVLDDEALILADPLAHSLRFFLRAFSVDFLRGFLSKEKIYYRPLTTVSFQANYSLWGPNALAFRVTNLVLYLAVCLLVFALARRLTKSLFAAAAAAVLFAVLPSHAEAVAWISGRTELISTFFVLAGLLLFCKAEEAQPGFNLPLGLASSFLFTCALFAKESAAIFPALLFGYLWIFGRSRGRKSSPVPAAAVIALPVIVYFSARHLAGCVGISEHATLLLRDRLFGIGIAYACYLRMLFVPRTLCVIYDIFPIALKHPAIGLAAWLAPLGLAALAISMRKRAPVVAFGAFWILVSLLPFVNLVPSLGPLPAERFTFMPSVGSALILGWLAWRAYEYRPRSFGAWPVTAAALLCGFALYCAALTVSSCPPYESDVGWARAIAATNVRFAPPHAAAGYYLCRAGLIREGLGEYDKAIARDRGKELDAGTFVYVARLKRSLGEPGAASRILEQAEHRFPESANVQFNLGLCYVQLNKMQDAAAAFSRAFRLDPSNAAARRDLARALAAKQSP